MINNIKIERTGRFYSIASSEYLVTFPNGSTQIIWSPIWNDWDEETEDAEALRYAKELWDKRDNL